jgi:hypothetical protein
MVSLLTAGGPPSSSHALGAVEADRLKAGGAPCERRGSLDGV